MARTLLVGWFLATLGLGQAPDPFAATYTVTSTWSTGFQADLVLTNLTGASVTTWALEFDFGGTIASLWNGQMTSPATGHYRVTPPTWGAPLAAGGSHTVSFTASGSSAPPTNAWIGALPCSVNGVPNGSVCPPTTNWTPPPAASTPGLRRVVGYYPSWSIYARNYHVSSVPADALTHINYAFANISGGVIQLGDPYADVDRFYPGDSWAPGALRGSFNQLRILKSQHPHLKTLISVGGWTWSGQFSDVALTPQSRQTFAQSCVTFLVDYGFDGVDIDWEYPVAGGLPSNVARPADRQNFTLLLQELRQHLDARSAIDGRPYLLTIATAAGVDKIANLEPALIQSHVDWINVMAYDFHGGWSSSTNFHAPLFAAPGDPTPNATIAQQYNADAAMQAYLGAGVPAEKLVLGCPFYGRGWSGVPNSNDGLHQPYVGIPMGTWDDGQSGATGVFDYDDLIANYVTNPTRHWHPVAQVPWFYDPATGLMVSYEDAQSLTNKVAYIQSQGFGGAMLWELNGDDATHSLTHLLYQQLVGPAVDLQAATSGQGDLFLRITTRTTTSSHVLLLASATLPPGGVGTGAAFGLTPDPLTWIFLGRPAAPFDPFHYPLSADPYASGPFALPPCTLGALTGSAWDLLAVAYPTLVPSGIVRLSW